MFSTDEKLTNLSDNIENTERGTVNNRIYVNELHITDQNNNKKTIYTNPI